MCSSTTSWAQSVFLERDFDGFPGVTAKPVVVGASNCSGTDIWDVALAGGQPGGEYAIDATDFATFNAVVGRTPVAPNKVGITFVQIDFGGYPQPLLLSLAAYASDPVTGTWSKRTDFALRDPGLLPVPNIRAPLFTCGLATELAGHQPGDSLELWSGATLRAHVPHAFGQTDYTPLFPTPGGFAKGESLLSRYLTCDRAGISPASAQVSVVDYPSSTLPPPEPSVASTIAGADRFSLFNVENGAALTLEVRRGNSRTTWTEICGSGVCTAYLPPAIAPLQYLDEIRVSQALCPGSESIRFRTLASACYSSAPTWATPLPRAGDTQVRFSDRVIGGKLTVYECILPGIGGPVAPAPIGWENDCMWKPIGTAFDSATVELERPVLAGEALAATQEIGTGCPPIRGSAVESQRE